MSKNYIFTAILFLLLAALSKDVLCQDLTGTESLQQEAFHFSFDLKKSAQTSAGVYTMNGVLLRTLWSGVPYSAGTHTGTWDGKDDNGKLAPNADYHVKVLSNNVTYTWEGVIGNTSDLATGDNVHRSFDAICGMAITGNRAFTCAEYAEQTQAQAAFDIRDVQKKIRLFSDYGTNQETRFVATDGENVYWAGFDPFSSGWSHNFVFASKVSDNSEVSFTTGISLKMTYGQTYTSVIDYVNTVNAIPTGMAVQKKGNYLFVAHGTINQLHVVDKITGILTQNIAFRNPKGLAVDGNDNLWVISDNNIVTKYSVNSKGILTAGVSISGLALPLALAVSPDNSTLVICDGGASQQLKAFNNSTGTLLWTYGQKGGYTVSPDVDNDKFYFSDVSDGINQSYIAFQSDGSFWVGDAGNYRNLHFAANRTFLNQIMYLPHFYNAGADKNNANRVFAEFLEFKIDYSKPLAGNNGSWALVKNWRATVPLDYLKSNGDIGTTNVLKSIVTLANNHTYALTYRRSNSNWALVELPSKGGIRFTGIELNPGTYSIGEDGTLNQYKEVNNANQWISSPLRGFDAHNNPIWGTSVTIATTPADPNAWNAAPAGERTSSGVIIGFDNSHNDYGKGNNFHLGGVRRGGNEWLWRTAKNTSTTYTGEYPKDGAYDIGNGVEYGGGSALSVDRNIFWNYHGEFWKNGQTNEFTHVYDDGLFVATFGTNGYEIVDKYKAPVKMAGNTLSIFATKDSSGNVYIMGCDESYHGGIQRWKISNLNSINEQTVTLNSSAEGISKTMNEGRDLLAGLPRFGILKDGTAGWSRRPNAEDYTNDSKWWSAKTDVKTYGLSSPDLYIYYRQANGTTYTINRDLGNNLDLMTWKLTGQINFDQSYYNIDQNGIFLDILDNTGKIISRFYIKRSSYNISPATCSVYGNNQILVTDYLTKFHTVVSNKNQPLEIKAANGLITFKYAGFSATDVVFDASANWQNPTTLRFLFKTISDNYNRKIGVSQMQFFSTGTSTSSKISRIINSASAQASQKRTLVNSNIVNSTEFTGVRIYPNPVITNQLNVQFENIQKGIYQVKIVSTTGQVIMNKMINHEGNNSIQSFLLNGTLTNEQYQLQITGNGMVYSQQFIKM